MANIGGMATFRDRIDIIGTVIVSIARQIDLLWVYCNDEESYEALKTLPFNVKKVLGINLTDRGKFYPCQFYDGTDNVFFTLMI